MVKNPFTLAVAKRKKARRGKSKPQRSQNRPGQAGASSSSTSSLETSYFSSARSEGSMRNNNRGGGRKAVPRQAAAVVQLKLRDYAKQHTHKRKTFEEQQAEQARRKQLPQTGALEPSLRFELTLRIERQHENFKKDAQKKHTYELVGHGDYSAHELQRMRRVENP